MLDKCYDNQFGVRMADQACRSFYSRIRYVAISLKLRGLFPFENGSNDGRSLSFKWFGWNVLWGFALHATAAIVLYLLSLDENANRPLLYGYFIQIVIFYIFYMLNSEKLPKLLRILEEIDGKIMLLSTTSIDITSKNHALFIFLEIILLGIFCARETVFVLTASANLVNESAAIMTIVLGTFTSSMEVYISVLFISIINLHVTFYNKINEELKNSLEDLHTINTLTKFEQLRILHANLSDASDNLYEWFGGTLFCIFGTLLAKTLLKVYLITIVYSKISLIKDFSTFIFVSLYILVLTYASQNLVDSSRKICNIINNVSPLELSSALQLQFRLAIQQTTTLPVNTMALGLFNTTRSLVPSILSAVAVYITVIIELEAPLEIFTIMLKRGSHYNITK